MFCANSADARIRRSSVRLTRLSIADTAGGYPTAPTYPLGEDVDAADLVARHAR